MTPSKSVIVVVCIAGLASIATSKSRPKPQPPTEPKPVPQQSVEVYTDGFCYEETESNCAPDERCNPPAPLKIDCPEDFLARIDVQGGECFLAADFKCPGVQTMPDGTKMVASCNPPAPKPILCPNEKKAEMTP